MRLLMTMAYRNLRRHKRRTLIMISTIAAGLAIFLWMQCVLAGRNKNMIDTVISSHTGHLQIYHPKYLKSRLIQDTLKWPQAGSEGPIGRLSALLPPGSVLARRIYLPSIISSGDQSTTIVLQGIEPEAEARITQLKSQLMPGAGGGEYLAPEPSADCPSRQIYLGKELAAILDVSIGSRIVVMTQAGDGTLGNDLFLVKGIYDSGSPDAEKLWAYTPLACAAKIGVISGVHEVAIRLPDDRETTAIRKRLVPEFPDSQVATWREALPSLSTMLKVNDATLLMTSLILFVVISLGIVNTLLIGIFERTREFGVMLALGTSPRQLMKIIVLEGLFMGLGAAFIGLCLGLCLVGYNMKFGFDLRPFLGDHTSVDQFKLDLLIYPVLEFGMFAKSTAVTVVLVMLTSLYPAARASRFEPIEAIRSY